MGHMAVILSGCGFLDGSEIHESVLCLLALSQSGHTYHCFAPDIDQVKVVDHISKNAVAGQERNVLVESARIARGEISPLSTLKVSDFDAVVMPGGYGAALHLSTFAQDQEKCTVNEDFRRVVMEFHQARKPIGATCITPVVLAKIFEGVIPATMTLGSSADANVHLSNLGMTVQSATAGEMISDDEHKVYTTPCYMEPPDLAAMYEGVKQMVAKL